MLCYAMLCCALWCAFQKIETPTGMSALYAPTRASPATKRREVTGEQEKRREASAKNGWEQGSNDGDGVARRAALEDRRAHALALARHKLPLVPVTTSGDAAMRHLCSEVSIMSRTRRRPRT